MTRFGRNRRIVSILLTVGWLMVTRIRSRVEVETTDGRKLVCEADENYRGGPRNPLSDSQLENKFRDCASGLLEDARSQQVFDVVWKLENQKDVTQIFDLLNWRSGRLAKSSAR